MQNTSINATTSANTSMDKGQSSSGGVYSSGGRRRVGSVLTAEEARRIDEENKMLGRKDSFSPAAIVDISKNAKRLWQQALEKRGGVMNIAKPYFSSRLLDKMRQAGQLGEGGLVSMAYKKMIDIFI